MEDYTKKTKMENIMDKIKDKTKPILAALGGTAMMSGMASAVQWVDEPMVGLVGGMGVFSLLLLAFGSIPVILPFILVGAKGKLTKKTMWLITKLTAIYAIIMAGIYAIISALVSIASGSLIGVGSSIVGALVVGIYLFVAGIIGMLLAWFIAKYAAMWLIKRFK